MLSWRDYLKKIAIAVFIGYCFWVFLLVSKSILINYPPPVNGYVLSNGNILGGDFIAFYTAGKIARSDKKRLYNFHFQTAKRNEILGNSATHATARLPFIYPPLIAWIFSKLAVFDLSSAFYLFTVSSALLAVSSLLLLFHLQHPFSILSLCVLLLCVFGFMPFYNNGLAGGQMPSMGIFIYALVFVFLKKNMDFIAGLTLSLGYYKPPLFLIFAFAMVLTRGRQFIFGCLCGGIVLTLASVLYLGPPQFLEYITIASRYTYGQELFKGFTLPVDAGMGVFALVTKLMPSMLWAVLAYAPLFLGALSISVICLIKTDPDSEQYDLAYAATVIASLALSLQLLRYDMSILLVPFVIIMLSHSVPARYRLALIVGMALFYVEWQIKKIILFGYVLRLPPLLFFLIFCILCLSIRHCSRNTSLAFIFNKKADRYHGHLHND